MNRSAKSRLSVIPFLLLLSGLSLLTSPPALADDFDDAEKQFKAAQQEADDFEDAFQKLRKLNKSELEGLVAAICQAEEADRKSVSQAAAKRVKQDVNTAQKDLDKLRKDVIAALDDAIAVLDAVANDPNFKNKKSKAEGYEREAKKRRKKVGDRWNSITKMTKGARGANHPVTAYMLEQGQVRHKDYQEDGSKCDASEVTLPSRKRLDCIKIKGKTAIVIELKPDNSRAISKGKTQARKYARELNAELKKVEDGKESEVLKELIKLDSDFEHVEEFEWEVRCYDLCPEIDDDGEFIRPVSGKSWRVCS
jgi:hypothetical protein